MAAKSGTALPARPQDAEVRDQLARVLGSQAFQQADRLKRFARFVVQEALEGRGSDLKEYVIGVQVFGREASFDPRTDPIVRVQARRLRARLDQYYRDEGRADDIVIELPKGGYAPVVRRRDGAAPARPSLGETVAGRHTVLVRPLADCSPGQTLGAFIRGCTDEIVHALVAGTRLRIVSGATGEAAADAGLIVDGSVRAAPDRVRLALMLVDRWTGQVLWSGADDVPLDMPLDGEQRLAAALVARLTAGATEADPAARALPAVSENLTARTLYLQGRYHLNQRTEDGLLKAVDFFERAVAEDTRYALAYSGLADAYGLLAHYGVVGPADVWAKAASSAASAVMLDALSAEAHTSLAHVHATQDWDWAAAEREFQHALRLNPRHATTHHWYAMSCLVPMARLDAALEHMRAAQSLDPVSSIISRDLAVIHLYRRDLDAALDQCDHTVELNPYFAGAYVTLGLVQEQRDDFDESVAALLRARELAPRSPRVHAALVRTYARAGRQAEAREALASLEALTASRYVSPIEFAAAHLALGDRDEGCRRLARAGDDRCFELLALAVDPRFDTVRDAPELAALTARLGLTTPR
jgi:serine/threonine-protein kinase